MEDLTVVSSLEPASSSELSALPEALQQPTRPVSLWFMLKYSFTIVIIYMCLTSIGLLLPLQINAIDPQHKVTSLGLVLTVGAILALIGNPLAGALSDRTVSRFGRRRPWVLVGALGSAVALVIMMNANSVLWLLVGWSFFQFTANCMLAPLSAIVPDQLPDQQRGTISAFAGVALSIGPIIGLTVIGQIIKVPQTSYVFLLVVLLAVMLPYALFLRDPVLPREYRSRFHLRAFFTQFWISPRKYPDFGWAWLTRFLAIFAYALGTGYTFYYLQDYVKIPLRDVLQASSTIGILATLLVMIFVLIGGLLSDRLKRRKIFVTIAGITLAVALLLYGLFPVWSVVLISSAILGAGLGLYLPVDGALVTQVLPSAESRGKDLGVINIANTLPQSLAPALAAFFISVSHSYLLLFVIAAIFSLLNAFLIRNIKSIR